MEKFIGGLGLFLIGIMTIGSSEIIWTGGMVVGALLMVASIRDMLRRRRERSARKKLEAREQELTARLRQGEPIDHIAAQYYADYSVPPTRTLLVASHTLRELAKSGVEADRELARGVATRQHIDAATPPADYLSTLAFDRNVFYVEEEVNAHRTHPSTGKAARGTLILSKAYLYFIEDKKRSVSTHLVKRAVDRISDEVPFLGIATSGWSLMGGLSDELRNYFRPRNLSKLRARFSLPNSFAIPLAQIMGVHQTTVQRTLTSTSYLELDIAAGPHGPAGTYWLQSGGFHGSQWVSAWMERLELVCVAEGRMLGVSLIVSPV